METATRTQMLKLREVSARTTMERTTIWRAVRKGTFPRPLRISKQRVAWRESEVEAWLASRTSNAEAV
jgi:prophage regulatory protein